MRWAPSLHLHRPRRSAAANGRSPLAFAWRCAAPRSRVRWRSRFTSRTGSWDSVAMRSTASPTTGCTTPWSRARRSRAWPVPGWCIPIDSAWLLLGVGPGLQRHRRDLLLPRVRRLRQSVDPIAGRPLLPALLPRGVRRAGDVRSPAGHAFSPSTWLDGAIAATTSAAVIAAIAFEPIVHGATHGRHRLDRYQSRLPGRRPDPARDRGRDARRSRAGARAGMAAARPRRSG